MGCSFRVEGQGLWVAVLGLRVEGCGLRIDDESFGLWV